MLLLLLILIFAFVLIIFAINSYVSRSSSNYLYSDVTSIPQRKVGLLLGCSKFVAGGRINLFYQNRIDAAVKLFEAKKVEFILVSGDNRTENYNEPKWMKEDLVARGIPATKIYQDFAGLRTLDSVLRCNLIFQENKFTVISQPFHNERAVFIAKKHGIDAIGYNALDVNRNVGLRTMIREKLARLMMMIDLMSNKKPKHLGETIIIK